MINFKKRKKKGFTLIEIMIVIAIIGALALVLIPKSTQSKITTKETGINTNSRSIQNSIASIINIYAVTTDDAIKLKKPELASGRQAK